MTVRRALLLAALAVTLLPGAASAAETAPVSTSLDERWVCLGEPGKPAYCITLWFPGS